MLYVFYGPETHSRKEALDKLRQDLDSDGALATNMITLEASKSSPQEVIAACDTAPFLGSARLVIVEGVLTAAGRGKKPKKTSAKSRAAAEAEGDADAGLWGALAEYVARLPETTNLVIVDNAAPAGGLIDAFKACRADIREFKLPDEKQLAGYVMNRAKQMGLKLDAPAAKLLAELIGNDVWMLASELEKLATYAAGDVVRDKDVHALVSRAKEHKGWELSDAVVEGNGAKAARVLQELIDDGEPMPVMLATIVGRYRRVAIAKAMDEAGASGSEIASRLNMKMGYGLDKLLEQAQRHSWAALRRAYALAVQAETDVKRGLMEEQLALELYVQAMASPRRAPVAARP